MPLQQLLTVTKDANTHARPGDVYVRSQSLASTTSVPVETGGKLGELLPTSALKNVGKTKSEPLAKIPADEHIFSPPEGAVQVQNGSPVERLPIELDETLPYRSPQVREEGTLALR